MKNWMMAGVVALSIVTGTMGWLKAVEHFGARNADAPKLTAQGSYPVPPTPWHR